MELCRSFLLVFTVILILLIFNNVSGQLTSPCPRLFSYETNNAENDRWYGQITLLSDSELTGVWLRVIFDKPSIQLGNWFGEVVTQDNKEYLIKNPKHRLAANSPYTIRFYLKYNPAETPPKLETFRLNAKTVCPEGKATTAAPTTIGQLLTSSELSTTVNPLGSNRPTVTHGGGGSGAAVGGGGGSSSGVPFPPFTLGNDDDDYYKGDFEIFNSHHNKLNVPGTCGTVIKQPRPLIYHGVETSEAEFPWHGAIYHAKGVDLAYICGGSLISKQHLLTVAHCVTKRKSNEPLNPESLVIYLGKFYLKRWSNPGIQDRHVQKIIPHPNYDSTAYGNDIAILKFTSPVEVTNFVRPVCVWEGKSNLEFIIGKQGVVVGWGFDETGTITDQLTKAHMPVVSQETCIYSFPDFYSRFTSSKTFCAGFRNGTSVCNGDSGGGMVFPKTSGNNPIWHIRGLISIGVALQNHFSCDATHYVVFTDVAKYIDWIKMSLHL